MGVGTGAEERNALVAKILLIEFEAATGLIAESPNRWPRIGGRYRRFVLGRFPFSIVYMLRSLSARAVGRSVTRWRNERRAA